MKLKPSELKPNPNNPRTIKNEKFRKLVKSLQEFPEMADVREVVINKDHVILGGNMRFRAMVEAGWKEIPVKIVDWTEQKQREFIIKDNVSGGDWDWDAIANEWNVEQVEEWGVDVPKPKEQEVEGDEPFTEYFGEENDYIIIVADNDIDVLNMKTLFDQKVKMTKRGQEVTIRKRVYKWSELKEITSI